MKHNDEGKRDYYGTIFFSPEVEALADLEAVIGTPLPKLDTIEWGHTILGFSSREGHVIELCIVGPRFLWAMQNTRRMEILSKSIGKFKDLKVLSIRYTDIFDLPEEIGNLATLEVLDLHDNNLSTLPENIGNLLSLHTLSIFDVHFQTLPESIGELQALKNLSIYDTDEDLFLPESLGQLQALEDLDIYNCFLKQLPESIGNLKSLKRLTLACNSLTRLPVSFANLKALEYLDISQNLFPEIPTFEGLDALKKVDYMQCCQNHTTSKFF